MSRLRNLIVNTFKLYGLSIRSDGTKELCNLLEPLDSSEHREWIEKVIDAIQKLPVQCNLVSKDVILQAAQEVNVTENDDLESLLQTMDIYTTPKLVYNIERRKFVISQQSNQPLHGEASDKTRLFLDRYTLIFQRISNHELFKAKTIKTSSSEDNKFGLVKIEYLLGSSSKQDAVVVLGLLTQMVEGVYHLEDDTGTAKLDLSKSMFHIGLFTQNCIILVEGNFDDGTLVANAIGLPPCEDSNVTRALLGNVNYFGGPSSTCAKYDAKLQNAEAENEDSMLVVLSDVWLDKLKVMEKLHKLFSGYSQFPPTAFIFCGNFLSEAHGAQQITDLKAALSSLADMITEFPNLTKNCKFYFVPGPSDPGPSNILPRPPLPDFICGDFKARIPTAEFVSNPCRLQYCTQEIVILREDIFTKMCRNCVYFPSNSSDIPSHFAKTILSQSHLAPLPLHVVPVYWGLDHCLCLHPTPDVLITADKGDAFTTSDNKCLVFNPGSFVKTDFSFKVYLPSKLTVEDSQIADDS